ncbi:MAG: class I SAM-dependent methyltransferase [Thiotrichales bacterium]
MNSSIERDATAESVSAKLKELIAAEIDSGGGFMSFRRFMELALYAPGLGYYVAGARKFGAGGDFITAPEISSLFSSCLAMQCREVLTRCDGDTILEFGAGSGAMAADVLKELAYLNQPVQRYVIVELSPELRERQRGTIMQHCPQLLDRVEWLDSLEGFEFNGVVLANEVLDAMPVEAFESNDDGFWQRGVSLDKNGEFCSARIPMPALLQTGPAQLEKNYGASWQKPYRSEWNPQLSGWFQALYNSLNRGGVILVDYGYPGSEYYHPQRTEGTLIAHYQHRSHIDLLSQVGLQDITANVDFTAVADAAISSGFEYSGYTTQAFFLMANGLDQIFQRAQESADVVQQVELSRQVRQLTLPAEMGERFQVIAFTKSMAAELQGFGLRDLSHRL